MLTAGFEVLGAVYEVSTVVTDVILNAEYIRRKWIEEYALSIAFLVLNGVVMAIILLIGVACGAVFVLSAGAFFLAARDAVASSKEEASEEDTTLDVLGDTLRAAPMTMTFTPRAPPRLLSLQDKRAFFLSLAEFLSPARPSSRPANPSATATATATAIVPRTRDQEHPLRGDVNSAANAIVLCDSDDDTMPRRLPPPPNKRQSTPPESSPPAKKARVSDERPSTTLLDGQRVLLVPLGSDVSRKRLVVWQEIVTALGGTVMESMEALRANADSVLTSQQQIGLRYYDDFLTKIPRGEVQEIEKTVVDEGMKVEAGEAVVCESEVDVFIALGLEYKDPTERNCFDIRFLDEDEANAKKGGSKEAAGNLGAGNEGLAA
ncbi:hypothetical protein P43SY_008257 [Pythium insidiosum]|uniref:Uncharacterized protein n=1 Tax=Pythium insidiosum TaxID=114742 RepID=A0AAD5LTS5_PYTIN|nr:hypothetical protein P43SY_008257 [Pythium insidiosum]